MNLIFKLNLNAYMIEIPPYHSFFVKKIFKNLFVTTASSTPSEALFSLAGDVITCERNRLKHETAEMLLILRNKVKLPSKLFSYKLKVSDLHY